MITLEDVQADFQSTLNHKKPEKRQSRVLLCKYKRNTESKLCPVRLSNEYLFKTSSIGQSKTKLLLIVTKTNKVRGVAKILTVI